MPQWKTSGYRSLAQALACVVIHWPHAAQMHGQDACLLPTAARTAATRHRPGSRRRVSRLNFAEKCKHCAVELLGPLQRCEMTHIVERDESRMWNAPSEIFGVFTFDEFILLALYDRHRHADRCQVLR